MKINKNDLRTISSKETDNIKSNVNSHEKAIYDY